MSVKIFGNTKNLSPSDIRSLERLYRRSLEPSEMLNLDLGRELYDLAKQLGLRIGILINREGQIEHVLVGTREILYLPDLGRYRIGRGRLRRLRLIFSDLGNRNDVVIPQDIFTDLEKLRLDVVCAIKHTGKLYQALYAYNLPIESIKLPSIQSEQIEDLGRFKLNFIEFIEDLEAQHVAKTSVHQTNTEGALLVGVYNVSQKVADASLFELTELARTAGVPVLGQYTQRKHPDPKTLVGKGKLNELVLEALRLGANMLIFDTELKPAQWRVITNSTELKVIDRSMLILDIFAQRAKSSAGRLQVELAQLKYNLPRLVEKDAGLSRLSGGIGGRGPGETKLEVGRRRIRDRISRLDKMIVQLSSQRELLRQKRKDQGLKMIALLGYTNAGKSTLFNALTKNKVLAENKLFATLDPTQARLGVPVANTEGQQTYETVIIADTVGFIRNLPQELVNAFRATLEELNEADLLLHVMDAADPDLQQKFKTVMDTLTQLDLLDIPIIHVLNKVDLLDNEIVAATEREFDAISVSASNGLGFSEFKSKIGAMLFTA